MDSISQGIAVILVSLAYFSVGNIHVQAENCDKLGVMVYEDLTCKPVFEKGQTCPKEFKCGKLTAEPGTGNCVVQGKTYSPGGSSRIAKNSVGLSCQFGCFCSSFSGKPAVTCAQGTCVEYSGMPPPEGCYRTYNLKQCCSSGENCEPPESVTKCVVDGKEYREGERFVPKDSCHTCVCQKGYKGKNEAPFCKRYGCDVQIWNQNDVQKKCAPVYINKYDNDKKDLLCCPKTWTCHDGTESTTASSGHSSSSDSVCNYGDKTLKIGDSFTKQITYRYRPENVKCECKIPPLLTCTEAP